MGRVIMRNLYFNILRAEKLIYGKNFKIVGKLGREATKKRP